MKRGKAFIICGPSGVGKGTLIDRLRKDDPTIYFSVSATTRDPRKDEIDGVHYRFVTNEQFQSWLDEDAFLEYDIHFRSCYGTLARYVDQAIDQGRDAILDIDVKGSDQVKRKRPESVRIFIAPPSMEELERRLTKRGTENPDEIRDRMARAKEEMRRAPDFDYLIVNDSLEEAVQALQAIILAEHCRPGGK